MAAHGRIASGASEHHFRRNNALGVPEAHKLANFEGASSHGFAFGRLPSKEECFRERSTPANFKRAEILIPIGFGNFWLRFYPQSKLIQIRNTDQAIMHALDKVPPDAVRQIIPAFDFRHQPNTIRPSCSPRRLTSSASVAERNRSASCRNSWCFRFSASMPLSSNSTTMRFALRRRFFAMVRTCAARFAGSVMLWRTVLLADFMPPVCTKTVSAGAYSASSNLPYCAFTFHNTCRKMPSQVSTSDPGRPRRRTRRRTLSSVEREVRSLTYPERTRMSSRSVVTCS